jgi:hypothetical protein
MGTYATTTSLETLLVGVTFDTVTTSLVSKLITHSENEVNKYLSKRYDVSAFTTTSMPPLVTSLTETLTEGYYYQRSARGGKDGLAHGKALIDQALDNLNLIALRKLDLLDSDGNVIAEGASSSYQMLSTTDDYAPTFNEDSPLNWVISPEKLDDIEDERE